MIILALGILLFCAVHLVLSTPAALATALNTRLQPGPRKALVSILTITGIALMVIGWRSVEIEYLWQPPPWATKPAIVLAILGIYLFVVAQRSSNIKRVLRHPQLTGLACWAAGHLLVNGDNRSVLLFACLIAWSLVEIIAINHRDAKPNTSDVNRVGVGTELVTLVIALIAIVAVVSLHQWFSGVPLVAIAASL